MEAELTKKYEEIPVDVYYKGRNFLKKIWQKIGKEWGHHDKRTKEDILFEH